MGTWILSGSHFPALLEGDMLWSLLGLGEMKEG